MFLIKAAFFNHGILRVNPKAPSFTKFQYSEEAWAKLSKSAHENILASFCKGPPPKPTEIRSKNGDLILDSNIPNAAMRPGAKSRTSKVKKLYPKSSQRSKKDTNVSNDESDEDDADIFEETSQKAKSKGQSKANTKQSKRTPGKRKVKPTRKFSPGKSSFVVGDDSDSEVGDSLSFFKRFMKTGSVSPKKTEKTSNPTKERKTTKGKI